MYAVNEETKQFAMRLLFINNDNRDVNMTLQTKTTLETSTKICVFKNQLKGYKSLNDLYTFAEVNNFSIFFVPNADKMRNWIFLDIDSQTKDTEGKRKMLSKDEMKIITQVLINLNVFQYCTYVLSGTGLHIYIELAFSATEEEFDMFHGIISNSMQNAGIVVDEMNQTHRMRFPGAINEKYNKKSQVLPTFYSDLKLDKKHFDEFTNRDKKVEVLKALESADMKDFEVKKNKLRKETKNILIEIATFERKKIRDTSRKYNVRTESSARFEKKLSPRLPELAFLRMITLMKELGVIDEASFENGKINVIDYIRKDVKENFENEQNTLINFNSNDINKILGMNISEEKMIDILTELGFKKYNGETSILVKPYIREDIERKEDLAEEVIRFYGYDNLNETLPKVERGNVYKVNDKDISTITKDIRNLLKIEGYNQIITYRIYIKR